MCANYRSLLLADVNLAFQDAATITRIMDVRRCGTGNPDKIVIYIRISQTHAYLCYD